MIDRPFTLDTNILVHALDRPAGDQHRLAGRIIDLARRSNCWLTLQSISEFYAAVTRKRPVNVTAAQDQALDWLRMFRTVSASSGGSRAAPAAATTGRASYWDAL